MARFNYSNLGSPYNSLLHRESDLSLPIGMGIYNQNQPQYGNGANNGTTQTPGGSVETVSNKSEGSSTDLWIKNYIRSVNWKPKKIGFYIDGATGYAEFANIYVAGTIVVNTGTIGGFSIGSDYIKDAGDTMGMASTVTGGDDVRFWAGDTFDNRASAPFRVTESGDLYANNAIINGGSINGAIINNANGVTDPTTTPEAIGQIYINTALGRCFMAIGTNSDADWLLLETSALPRSVSEFEAITVTESVAFTGGSSISVYDDVFIVEDISLAII